MTTIADCCLGDRTYCNEKRSLTDCIHLMASECSVNWGNKCNLFYSNLNFVNDRSNFLRTIFETKFCEKDDQSNCGTYCYYSNPFVNDPNDVICKDVGSKPYITVDYSLTKIDPSITPSESGVLDTKCQKTCKFDITSEDSFIKFCNQDTFCKSKYMSKITPDLTNLDRLDSAKYDAKAIGQNSQNSQANKNNNKFNASRVFNGSKFVSSKCLKIIFICLIILLGIRLLYANGKSLKNSSQFKR